MASKNKSFGKHFFLFSLLAIHLFYFIVALVYRDIYTLDSPEYLLTALNLKLHATSYNASWSTNLQPAFYSLRPPGYPVFILLATSVCNSHFFVIFMQNIISIFICLSLLKLLAKNGYKKYGEWFIIISLILFPPYLILVNSIMAEIFLLLWLMAAFLFLLKYLDSSKSYYIIAYNIALCPAVLAKPVMMYFWIPNLVFSVYLYAKHKSWQPVIFSFLLQLTVFLWSARNEKLTGYFHYSSIKMQNIVELNVGSIIAAKQSQEKALEVRKEINKKADEKPDFKTRSEYVMDTSAQIIKSNFGTYLYAHAKGMLNFMLATGRVDVIDFFPYKPAKEISLTYEIEKQGLRGLIYYFKHVNIFIIVLMLLVFVWNVISLFLMLAALFSKDLNITIKIFLFLLIGYIVFACGPGGYARFKVSILPFIIFLLPYGYTVLRNIFQSFIKGAHCNQFKI